MAAFSWRYRLHVHKLLFPSQRNSKHYMYWCWWVWRLLPKWHRNYWYWGWCWRSLHKEGLDVTTSGSFTITIGAGGASVYASGSTSGTAGGNTTVAGTGLSATLTANGGGGGVAFAITENGAAGGAGGTASNGTINRTGGAGGTVGAGLVTTGNRALMELSTGGGAVAILTATGYAGGSITLADGGTKFTNDMYLATGGAGIGGRGVVCIVLMET